MPNIQQRDVMFVFIFVSSFLLSFIVPGLSELSSEGANVCGPRTRYVTLSRTVRTSVKCPEGTCQITSVGYFQTSVGEYFHCCSGFSQTNTNCSEACAPDQFGENCTQSCDCVSNRCNSLDGTCECLPGYRGVNCTEPCETGNYGVNCRGVCDCRNGGSCDRVHGTCTCRTGFIGQNCERKAVESTTANNNEDPLFAGNNRQTGIRSSTIIAVVVPVCFLIVAVVVIGVVFICKRSKLPSDAEKSNNLHEVTTTSPGNNTSSDESNQTNPSNNASTGTQMCLKPKSSKPEAESSKPEVESSKPEAESSKPEADDKAAEYDDVLPPLQSAKGSLPPTVDPKYTSVIQSLNAKQTPLKPSVKPTGKPVVPKRQPKGINKDDNGSLPMYAEVEKPSKPPPPQKPSNVSASVDAESVPLPTYAIVDAESVPLPTYATVVPSPPTSPKPQVAEAETPPTYALIGEHPLGNKSPDVPAPPIPTEAIPALHDAADAENAYDLLKPRSPTITKDSPPSIPSPYDTPATTKSKTSSLPMQQYATPNYMDQVPAVVSNTLPAKTPAVGTAYGVVDLSNTNLSHGEIELRHGAVNHEDTPSAANPVYQTLAVEEN